MIRTVTLRRFKRFADQTFEFPGHIVLAGPNNTGKTTVLQAVAAWDLAFNRWRELNDFGKHKGAYTKAPLARQAFSAVPLRAFDLLWEGREYRGVMEVEIQSTEGWNLTMEFISDSTEQIYVRPRKDVESQVVRNAQLRTIYVPPMTGLSTNETVYNNAYRALVLGQGKPGDIIRNLLLDAYQQSEVWEELQRGIRQMFGYELQPPQSGAWIIAEYKPTPDGQALDVASAGSGFQQVLMLLTFLYTNPASVLLLDEPDAHLHLILQQAIYSKLRSVADRRRSQLIIATHSEVIINSVEPTQLCLLLDRPRLLATSDERSLAKKSLGVLSNSDIMLAKESSGVLYAEGYTDIAMLGEWANILEHPTKTLFAKGIFWKPTVDDTGLGVSGCKAKDHYAALQLVQPEINGIELIDGDHHRGQHSTSFEQGRLQRQRWRRYEIESYLIHPAAIDRYIEQTVGAGDVSAQYRQDARRYFEQQLPSVIDDPLGEHLVLEGIKASERILPAMLSAAGVYGIEKRDYYEIAALMKPDEIHPEIIEKLDAIQQVFGL